MGAAALAFVVSGLIPLALILAGWWDARSVLILYWAELLVVGLFAMARMLCAQRLPVGLRMLAAAFFYTVYFGFVTGYGSFIAYLVGVQVSGGAMTGSYVSDVIRVMRSLLRAMPP